MAFMQKQIYFSGYFAIDTTHGIQIVPDDVIGRTVSTHVEAFANYIEGEPLDDDEMIEHQTGWLGRMSAPGYMDCTEWSAYKTEQEANEHLEEMYGEDE
jgi:hypothetical protein